MIEKVQKIKFQKIDENIVVFFNKKNKFIQNQVKELQKKLEKTKLKNYVKLITINTNEKKFNFESFSKSKDFKKIKICYILDCQSDIIEQINNYNFEVINIQSKIIADELSGRLKKYYCDEIIEKMSSILAESVGGFKKECYVVNNNNGKITKAIIDIDDIITDDDCFTDLSLAKFNSEKILNAKIRLCESNLRYHEKGIKFNEQKIKEYLDTLNEVKDLE